MYGGSGTCPSASMASSNGRSADRFECDATPAEEPLFEHLVRRAGCRARATGSSKTQARSRLELLTGMHERPPVRAASRFEQQALDRAAARIAPAEESRRKHARVVGDDEVARPREATAGPESTPPSSSRVARSTTSSRDVPRGRGSCAMRSGGRSKSNDETSVISRPRRRAPGGTDWSARSPAPRER